MVKPPKSDASRRTVSVPSFVVDESAQRLAEHADGPGFLFTAPVG